MIFLFGDSLPLDTDLLNQIPPTPPNDLGMTFIKMIATFAFLICLLYGTYWFIRRLIQQRLQKGVGEQSIHILEKKMISTKTMLYLIEVEGKKTLLAESHLEIKHLESYTRSTPSVPKGID